MTGLLIAFMAGTLCRVIMAMFNIQMHVRNGESMVGFQAWKVLVDFAACGAVASALCAIIMWFI
jgi:hypothetical protein